jgi:hypothetical protein
MQTMPESQSIGLKIIKIALWMLFAIYMGVAAVVNFSSAEYAAGSVNLILAVASLFISWRKTDQITGGRRDATK